MANQKKDNSAKDKYLVPAITQAVEILSVLEKSASSHMKVTEIGEATGFHSSRVYAILYTLERAGFVQKDFGGKGYSLGSRFISFSRKVLQNIDASQLVKPFLEKLTKMSECTTTLSLIVHNQLSIVAKHESEKHDFGFTVRVGKTFSLTHSVGGLAVVAFLPEKEQKEILRQKKLYFHNRSGEIDRSKMMKDLEMVRKRGYAVDKGKFNPNISAVASPVFGINGSAIGNISIIGILNPESTEEFGPILVETSREFSQLLGAKLQN